jgi:DNA-binding HxlR family transcriptional regulator
MTAKSPISPPPRPCPLEKYLGVISGAWVPRILWHLLERPRRFADLQRDLDGISAKVLASKLRALEREQIVKRTVHPTNPPQVEYAITARGRAFEPVFRAMELAASQLFPPPDEPPVILHAKVKSPRPRQTV